MIKLVVGLGNPGKVYASTRHNLGYQVVDLFLRRYQIKLKPGKGEFLYQKIKSGKKNFYVAKPTTFMNDSGIAVLEMLEKLKVKIPEMLLVCDDFNLPLGKIRLREKGSDGGHNGLKSVIYHIGSLEFPRLRLGIGAPPEKMPTEVFVLEKFDKSETEIVEDMLSKAEEAVEAVIQSGLQKAMNKYN